MLSDGDTSLEIKIEGLTEGRSTGGEVEGWQSVLGSVRELRCRGRVL